MSEMPKLAEMQALTEEMYLAEAKAQELRERMDAIEEEALEETIGAVRSLITASGFTMAAVVTPLYLESQPVIMEQAPKAAANVKRIRKSSKPDGTDGSGYPIFALKADETKTYIRGPLPNWMKKAMQDANLDPGSKADRDTFKAGFMIQLAA